MPACRPMALLPSKTESRTDSVPQERNPTPTSMAMESVTSMLRASKLELSRFQTAPKLAEGSWTCTVSSATSLPHASTRPPLSDALT